MGEKRNACSVLVGKSEGKRPLGISRLHWEDNIKIALKEMCSGGVDWIHLALDRDQWRTVANTVMNIKFPE
jgi:hypothetical protein